MGAAVVIKLVSRGQNLLSRGYKYFKCKVTKFLSANFQKNVKSKLYHTENSKTRGQTV